MSGAPTPATPSCCSCTAVPAFPTGTASSKIVQICATPLPSSPRTSAAPAGLTKASTQNLTLDQFVDDARDLAKWLCEKYARKKIFICGGSWGSELGTFLAFRYPEYIGAYVGYGQVVNGPLNEEISYRFSMEKAAAADDQKSVGILEKYGPPENGQYKEGLTGLLAQRRIMKKYGGHSMKKGGYFKTTVLPILFSGEYTAGDIYGTLKGYSLVLSAMWPLIMSYDFVKDCNTFEMPYYIFQGRHDNNTPSALVQGFYDAI